MSFDLLAPTSLRTAVDLDHAAEVVEVLATSVDGDELADALEAAASDADLAHAVLYRLVERLRGWDSPTGVEMVAGVGGPPVLWVPGA